MKQCRFAPGFISIFILTLFLSATFMCDAAQAQVDTAGLVMTASGDATYEGAGEKGETAAVRPLMKIYKGDALLLPEGAEVNLVFFKDRRRESWQGPVRLSIGIDGATPSPAGASPMVDQIKDEVASAMRFTSLPFPRDREFRSGGVVVRGVGETLKCTAAFFRKIFGPKEAAEIQAARQTWKEMKQQAAPDDLMPDLYLLSVLSKYDRYGEMTGIVADMTRTDPFNPTILNWQTWIDMNYPVQLGVICLSPDDACKKGDPDCTSLGSLGQYRRKGPFLPFDAAGGRTETGNIMTFILTNTSESDYYCYLVNIDAKGDIKLIYPEGKPSEAALLAAGASRNLLTDAGFGLFLENKGEEVIRLVVSSGPVKERKLTNRRWTAGSARGREGDMRQSDFMIHVE